MDNWCGHMAQQLRQPYPISECLDLNSTSRLFQLPANAQPARQQVTAQLFGSWSPKQGTILSSRPIDMICSSPCYYSYLGSEPTNAGIVSGFSTFQRNNILKISVIFKTSQSIYYYNEFKLFCFKFYMVSKASPMNAIFSAFYYT